MEGSKDRVRLNVGGRIFETTSTTLANAGRGSFFGAMLDDEWSLLPQPNLSTGGVREYFIDRNPDYFGVLLDLLRTRTLCIPPSLTERFLYKEAEFYGLTSLVREAKWGPLNGNMLIRSDSVGSQTVVDRTAIRASPEGGCCTVHGCMVKVFDWTLCLRCSPINLDYQQIKDVCWVDSESIVVTANEGLLGQVKKGGMGLFSSSTGQLRHRFRISKHNKSYTAGALSYNPNDYKIFAACKEMGAKEHGVGMWDQVTGQKLDVYYNRCLVSPNRVQWLDGCNGLLVSSMYPFQEKCCISLLDFRSKSSMVWSWSDAVLKNGDGRRIRDAVAVEERGMICVVNDNKDLGFMDLRRSEGGVRWRDLKTGGGGGIFGDELCIPKLAAHGGQLFCSINNNISVFCGADWVPTSTFTRDIAIKDFSIGGDRLFVLNSKYSVFDVLETPPLN